MDREDAVAIYLGLSSMVVSYLHFNVDLGPVG